MHITFLGVLILAFIILKMMGVNKYSWAWLVVPIVLFYTLAFLFLAGAAWWITEDAKQKQNDPCQYWRNSSAACKGFD